MYRCCIHIYLIGKTNSLFETMKAMAPLEHFTHEFCESDVPSGAVSAADVIFAVLPGLDAEGTVRSLLSAKRSDAELIVLAEREQTPEIIRLLDGVKDMWLLPMSGEELQFRFLRWQQACKADRDARETAHFLEATINSVPNLVWYKDKNGVHEKVNDSFCRIVNKTKKQVEGRGHAYIWDVEHDDPACIESEREVMTTRRTCISEETVRSGSDTKLLTTYKSPLYDFDGSVMGTVGVAIDITKERAFEREVVRKTRSLEKL